MARCTVKIQCTITLPMATIVHKLIHDAQFRVVYGIGFISILPTKSNSLFLLLALANTANLSAYFEAKIVPWNVSVITKSDFLKIFRHGNNNSFPKHLRQPCKERRAFGVDVHHIVFSKCTIKCRKCGRADCGESP